jgi:hypothetical protein
LFSAAAAAVIAAATTAAAAAAVGSSKPEIKKIQVNNCSAVKVKDI